MDDFVTPKKCAATSLIRKPESWTPPVVADRSSSRTFTKDSRLDLAGISEDCSLEDLQSLVKVAVDRCVNEEDGQKRVLINFTHLVQR